MRKVTEKFVTEKNYKYVDMYITVGIKCYMPNGEQEKLSFDCKRIAKQDKWVISVVNSKTWEVYKEYGYIIATVQEFNNICDQPTISEFLAFCDKFGIRSLAHDDNFDIDDDSNYHSRHDDLSDSAA